MDPDAGAKKENIVLDGRIRDVLGDSAFDVELANGHRLVGFLLSRDMARAGGLGRGVRVRLEFSPYDMSKGRILIGNNAE
jgi:translation initiation factor IF-1